MKVGIINVTGYAGMELARILYRHPEVEITSVTGRSAAGQKLGDFLPHLSALDLTIVPEEDLGDVGVAFSALPQVASMETCAPLVRQGVRVVDISADFRLKNPEEYQQWYKAAHTATDLLQEAVYGLTEIYREPMRTCRLVANPGCYPTSALLALAPAVKEGIITADIIADAKSGGSGAGRGLGLMYHYSEANENVQAYGLDGHRHLPEITQELRAIAPGFQPRLTFLTHLIPMTRGILTTCYAPFVDDRFQRSKNPKAELLELYREFYRDEPFVRVVSTPPQTKHTLGNNDCVILPHLDLRTNRLMVVSVLDNLVKGAAGQAVQNMNVMCGYPETLGLESLAVYP
ncbi:MAG: N-acetyl-gamma-glutamyl-phosphate reductase [Chloroflexi bacterium]|nr:N-acetyl-gamma-glutamyl-phosphate reductase [Chloroflexota bacterium]